MISTNHLWRASAVAFGIVASLSLAGAGLAFAIWLVDEMPTSGRTISLAIALGLAALGVASIIAHRVAKASAISWPSNERMHSL